MLSFRKGKRVCPQESTKALVGSHAPTEVEKLICNR